MFTPARHAQETVLLILTASASFGEKKPQTLLEGICQFKEALCFHASGRILYIGYEVPVITLAC